MIQVLIQLRVFVLGTLMYDTGTNSTVIVYDFMWN
jgi:hypothetical protein